MTDPHPGFIGVFDSGVGGLSVLKAIRRRLPGRDLVYIADSAWVPYGEKPANQILERSRFLAGRLAKKGAAAVVIACNTATAAAAAALRAEMQIPVVGMEPAVKPATEATRSRVIGVLATTGTLRSAKFAALLDRFGADFTVLTMPCPGLVAAVERGDLDSPATYALIEQYVQPLVSQGADVLVLGCTHFPFLAHQIAAAAGPDVTLIETGEAVARQTESFFLKDREQNPSGRGTVYLLSTSQTKSTLSILQRLWEEPDAQVGFLSQHNDAHISHE